MRDRVSGFFWLAVGLISVYGSARYDLGTVQEPGPGFMPFLAGCGVTLTAIIILFGSFSQGLRSQARLSALWHGKRWWRPIIIGFLLLIYILILRRIGFLLTTFAILLIMFRTELFSWRKAVFVSILVSVVSDVLFSVFLKVTLPKGLFGF